MIENIYRWVHRKMSVPEERGSYSAGYWQHKVRVKALELCNDVKGKVLEVGCGEGLFLAKLALLKKDIEIYGVDNRDTILEKAKDRIKINGIKNVNLLLGDAIDLPFEDNYFDTVVCINVIFNLGSYELLKKALAELKRVSKKKGTVIIDFRKKNPLLLLKYKLAPYFDNTVKGLPLCIYSRKDILSVINSVGFSIIKEIKVASLFYRIAPIIVLELEKL